MTMHQSQEIPLAKVSMLFLTTLIGLVFFIKMLLEGARIGNLFKRLSFYRMERT
jgi:hypothetical protein